MGWFVYDGLPVYADDAQGVLKKLTDFDYFHYAPGSSQAARLLGKVEDLLENLIRKELATLQASHAPHPPLQQVLQAGAAAITAYRAQHAPGNPASVQHIQDTADCLKGLWLFVATPLQERCENLPTVKAIVDALIHLTMTIPR